MKLLIFDVDGTLTEKHTAQLLPGVFAYFAALDWDSVRVAWASNQGGVGLRHWMETQKFGEPEKWPTESEVLARLATLEEILIPPAHRARFCCYVSFAYQSKTSGLWSPTPAHVAAPGQMALFEDGGHHLRWAREWTKPAPGMLHQAMADAGASAEETIMVGDKPTDLEAAQAAGVAFTWARQFFK